MCYSIGTMVIKNDNVEKKSYKHLKGSKNPNWNNGTSEYKNHYQMKINRLEKLKQTKGKCEVCEIDAKMIHHNDENKNNHAISNLTVLCNKHHVLIHNIDEKKPYKTSKFIRKYGMTIREMIQRTNKSGYYIFKILKSDIGKQELFKILGINEKT